MPSEFPNLPSVYEVIRRALQEAVSDRGPDALKIEAIEQQVLEWVPTVGLLPNYLRVAIKRAAQEAGLAVVEE